MNIYHGVCTVFVWISLAIAWGNYIHILLLLMRCEKETKTSLNFADWNQLNLMNKQGQPEPHLLYARLLGTKYPDKSMDYITSLLGGVYRVDLLIAPESKDY